MGKLSLLILIMMLCVYIHTLPAHNPLSRELTKLMSVLKSEQADEAFYALRSNNGQFQRNHNGPVQKNHNGPLQRTHNGPAMLNSRGHPTAEKKEQAAEKRSEDTTCSTLSSGKEVCLMNSAGGVSIEENCLYAHNYVRGFHGTPDLKWSSSLEEKSREWAKHLSDIGYMEHSEASDYGENLYWSAFSFDTHASCGDAVYSWYSEVAEPYAYNYNQDQNPGSLHFTQVIWKETTEVGCGISRTTGYNTDYYVVCQYTPKGNWMGDFVANIPQPSPAVVWQTEQLDSAYDLEKSGQCFNKYDDCDKDSCTGMFSDFYKPYCGKECNAGC